MNFITRIVNFLFTDNKPCYRVLNTYPEPHNQTFVIKYQLQGKPVVLDDNPLKLLKEMGTVKGFSEHDSKFILELALKENAIIPKRIIGQIFEEGFTQLIIEDVLLEHRVTLTPNQIIEMSDLITYFSHADIKMIYYLLAQEEAALFRKKMHESRVVCFKKSNLTLLKSTLTSGKQSHELHEQV